MTALYPLRFHPILRRYLWGGRRLETLGKALGAFHDYAESWEVVDHGADQSVVANGPLAGRTLGELVRQHGRELLGRHAGVKQFPLLFKFLDAHDRLSIQVHPDDARAARLDPPDLGKTEAWVILAAEPGSFLYAGLRRGFDRAALEREVARDTCELCVERIEPRAGDCFFLPAGVVHALGPGLLVAEIQQASDTTYRLYDWSRRGPDGQPRPLHVAEALEAIDYERGPVAAQQPQPTARSGVEKLVACEQFVLDRWRLFGVAEAGGDDRSHIISVLEGAVEIEGDPAEQPVERGGVVLLPAEVGPVGVKARGATVLLDAYLP
ncbi:MAG TPA: type I phosphomannose isomerase catalytic subunit [Pirellulales bacterium]|jgi:mannose-6-phosphate isomerase|nr:type I phosphomannose isomerase catalytic subunit [Pirellulales bacterium]